MFLKILISVTSFSITSIYAQKLYHTELYNDGNIKTIKDSEEFTNLALKTLPKKDFDKNTWTTWTSLIMKESGRKGKDLFKPLRLCLTGQNNGPEMANLVFIMGRDKVIERLSNRN